MSRKTISFGQLLEYIDRSKSGGEPILHNLESDATDRAGIHREFLDNCRYLPKRKGGNVLFHEVLSFHAEDRGNLASTVLEDLTRHYLDLRAPLALAYARTHYEKDHVHVHVVISANNFGAARRLRLSRGQFNQILHQVELYQARRYPLLENSVAIDDELKAEKYRRRSEGKKKEPVRKTRRERERDTRLAREGRAVPSRKEMLATQVLAHIQAARTGAEFLELLAGAGLELYVNGKRTGVRQISNPRIKHRLETLNVHNQLREALQRWKVVHARLKALDQVEKEKHRREMIELGFRANMAEVLAQGVKGLTNQERERLAAIDRILRERRRRERENWGRTPPTP